MLASALAIEICLGYQACRSVHKSLKSSKMYSTHSVKDAVAIVCGTLKAWTSNLADVTVRARHTERSCHSWKTHLPTRRRIWMSNFTSVQDSSLESIAKYQLQFMLVNCWIIVPCIINSVISALSLSRVNVVQLFILTIYDRMFQCSFADIGCLRVAVDLRIARAWVFQST